jgi:hypothetical protein
MKTIILLSLITFLCLSNIVKSQTVPSSCTAADSIVKLYYDDADRLAIKHTFNFNLPYKDSVTINKPLHKTYIKALLAVFNATNLPARDTVVQLKIHANLGFVLNNVLFTADSSLLWMKNLRNNISPTGYSPLDSLMNKYYLTKQQYYPMSSSMGDMVVLKSDTNFNALALSDIMDVCVPQINIVEANGLFGDGSQITDSLNTSFTELTYSFGWGDCPAGCISRRFWSFRVFNDCSVQYIGSYGSSLPAGFMTVGIVKEESFKGVNVYPNPVKDLLYVNGEADFLGRTDLKISNALGQIVYSKNDINLNEQIDLSFLKAGIYYLKLESKNDQKMYKIIKE